jgi:hypothetical protein
LQRKKYFKGFVEDFGKEVNKLYVRIALMYLDDKGEVESRQDNSLCFALRPWKFCSSRTTEKYNYDSLSFLHASFLLFDTTQR